MANKIIQLSLLNSVRFVPLNKAGIPKYHGTTYIDDDWQMNLIRPWETAIPYAQKMERSDNVTIQVNIGGDITTSTSPNMVLCDSQGVPIYDFANTGSAHILPSSVVLTGNTYNGLPLTTWQFRFTFSNIEAKLGTALTDDLYYLTLSQNYSTPETVTYVSEPILLAGSHDNTKLIEYGCVKNGHGANFENLFPRFSVRVEAAFGRLVSASTDTGFNDQTDQFTTLYSNPYDIYRITLGSTSGIPDWMTRKLNAVFSCDNVFIDGKGFYKNESAKWEYKATPGYPMRSASIDLREQVNFAGLTSSSQSFVVYATPLVFPFVVSRIVLTAGVFGTNLDIGTTLQAAYITNSTSHNTFITTLNSQATTNGLTGSFSIVGTNVVYTNGPGEPYTSGYANVSATSINVGLTNTGTYFGYQYKGGFIVAVLNGVVVSNTMAIGTTILTTVALTVTAGSGNVMKLFLGNVLNFSGDAVDTTYFNHAWATIGGSVNPELQRFNLSNANITTADFNAIFAACKLSLVALTVNFSTLATITGSLFATNSGTFGNLLKIDLQHNNLNSSQVDSIINDYANNASIAAGGLFTSIFQATSAPPTGTSAAARANLALTYGWTINTD